MWRALTMVVVVSAGLAVCPDEVAAQSMSQEFSFAPVPVLKANAGATLSVRLTDAWTGTALSSRMVQFSTGEQYYLTSAGSYPTNSSGVASFRWTFTRPGRYRIAAFIPDGRGYLAQRKTIFVNVQ
jgi:hypothetical protein